MSRPAERVVFYNKRATAEQWIKEGKGAIKWIRLSCRTFAASAVRLQLHALAYILAISCARWRRPSRSVLDADEPEGDADQDRCQGHQPWSHRAFQMAAVAIPRQMFQEVLQLIAELRPKPSPAPA
jgi:hypothetical protein